MEPHINTSRITQVDKSGTSSGSFYDSIHAQFNLNLFGTIHKPFNDDIMKKLVENTKSDKTIEWKMRTGHINEYADLQKQNNLFGRVSNSGYSRYQQSWRNKDWNNNDVYIDKESASGFSGYLDDKRQATIIREHCRRKGSLYGPQAIGAVCGHETTKSIICGRVPSETNLPQAVSYDYKDTSSHSSSTKSCWKLPDYDYDYDYKKVCKSRKSTGSHKGDSHPPQRKHFPFLEPSRNSSPQNSEDIPRQTGKSGGERSSSSGRNNMNYIQQSSTNGLQLRNKMNVGQQTNGNNNGGLTRKDDGHIHHKPNEDSYANVLMTHVRNPTKLSMGTLGRVNLTVGEPNLGGGKSFERKSVGQAKMRTQKKFSSQYSSVKKPLRWKPKSQVNKRKSLPTNRLDDKRPKGPKIEGITLIKPFESQCSAATIRTVILPLPQAKYKHTM